jgi:ribosomal protein L14
MIAVETKLNGSDNVGILVGKCIHVYGGFFKKTFGFLGSKILVSVRKKNSSKDIKKKTYQAIIVRSKCALRRKSGHQITCNSNSFITLHHDGSYRGTMFYGPAPAELFFSKTVELNHLTTKVI